MARASAPELRHRQSTRLIAMDLLPECLAVFLGAVVRLLALQFSPRKLQQCAPVAERSCPATHLPSRPVVVVQM